ncbi:MAG: hypothetical protein ACE15E_21995 [Acidobacteriota bacterium]
MTSIRFRRISRSELPRFPGATRVLYYGYLTPAKLSPLAVHRDRFDSVALRLDKIRLEHAEYHDIEEQGIGNLVIREGTVLAKLHDLPAGLPDLFSDSQPKAVRLVELRLQPDDQILIAEGLHVTPGQVIARQDVSKQLRTLELQLAADTERLEADLEQIELQLNGTEQELGLREGERAELEMQLRTIQSQTLLSRETDKIEEALKERKLRIADLGSRRRLLLSRRVETSGRLQSVALEAAERRDITHRESEIQAGFEGKVVRILREAAASEVTLRISYEGPNDPAPRQARQE